MVKIIEVLILVIFLLRNNAIATEEHEEEEDPKDAFAFGCGENRVMSMHNRTFNAAIASCYVPYICGQVRFCEPVSFGSTCPGKFHYMTGLHTHSQGVTAVCCEIFPKPDGDETCYDAIINDKTFPLLRGPQPPKVPPTTVQNHQVHQSRPGPQSRAPAPRTKPRQGRSAVITPTSFTVKADIRPCGLDSTHLANEYIKAIQKTQNGYKVTICAPYCKSTTSTVTVSTRQPTTHVHTDKPHQSEKVHKKSLFGDGKHCYSSDMTVMTPDGIKRMDQLRIGDKVQIFTSEFSDRFQPISWFYHRDPATSADYLDLTTSSGHHLSISPNHLIPFIDCNAPIITAQEMDKLVITSSRFASRARIGMCLAVQSRDNTTFKAEMIVKIKGNRKRGLFSPITDHGTIVVNGIQTSCFSSVENHLLLKIIQTTLARAMHILDGVRSWITGSLERKSVDETGIPTSIKFLLEVAKQILPDFVFT